MSNFLLKTAELLTKKGIFLKNKKQQMLTDDPEGKEFDLDLETSEHLPDFWSLDHLAPPILKRKHSYDDQWSLWGNDNAVPEYPKLDSPVSKSGSSGTSSPPPLDAKLPPIVATTAYQPLLGTSIINHQLLDKLSEEMNPVEISTAFDALSKVLRQSAVSNPKFHGILNEWFSARLSRVLAAQMMVQYFAHHKQVCYMFQEVSNNMLVRRYIRSCIRRSKKKERTIWT